jgi:hypothetical protein
MNGTNHVSEIQKILLTMTSDIFLNIDLGIPPACAGVGLSIPIPRQSLMATSCGISIAIPNAFLVPALSTK